eukprot:1284902-Pyramimonas_sp.AAC.1
MSVGVRGRGPLARCFESPWGDPPSRASPEPLRGISRAAPDGPWCCFSTRNDSHLRPMSPKHVVEVSGALLHGSGRFQEHSPESPGRPKSM